MLKPLLTTLPLHPITSPFPPRLFDICPGLTAFQITVSPRTGESKGIAYATFSSVSCASYARQKLNNLEYPPGYRLSVGYCKQHGGYGTVSTKRSPRILRNGEYLLETGFPS